MKPIRSVVCSALERLRSPRRGRPEELGGPGGTRTASSRAWRPIRWPSRVFLVDIHTAGPPVLEILEPHEAEEARSFDEYETYYSAPAVRPLLAALDCAVADAGEGSRVVARARHALARFRAMTGEREGS